MPGDQRPQEAGDLDLLASGEMELLGLMPNASNYTFLARLHDGERETLAVYKPRAGETPLWDFPEGTLCQREVAAWELSDALGWDLVPPTLLRDGPHGTGSAQSFVAFDPQHHYFTLRDDRLPDFERIAAFDVLANNADRKAGHCLLAHDGGIRCIDHGVCFHHDPKLRTVVWDFAGDAVPEQIMDEVLGGMGAALERTAPYLDPLESKALAVRFESLLAEGRYPQPGTERHYPWPPV